MRSVAEKIEWAARAGRPLNMGLHSPAKWATAAEYMFRKGRLESAAYVARQLLAMHPDFRWAQLVARFSDHIPRLGPQLPFVDDETKDVQVVRRAGSDQVLLLFCDIRHHLNLPLIAMHRWFGQLPASLIYLRDFRRLLFLDGIPSLAPTRDGTVSALQDIISSLGGRRISCFGHSSGVFPALHYGLDLRGRAVLGMAGPVTLRSEFSSEPPYSEMVAGVAQHLPECMGLDMLEAYKRAESTPRVRLVFGADADFDRRHAEYLQELKGVELQPLTGYGAHNATIESVSRGLFPSMLDWLMES